FLMRTFSSLHTTGLFALAALVLVAIAEAEEPKLLYLFPAGGQRGERVEVRAGGVFFHGRANFEMAGQGVSAPDVIEEIGTLWFEGPIIGSNRPEDYPRDHGVRVTIDADAQLGERACRAWTSQGITLPQKFIVGHLPEVIEKEVEGPEPATQVALPVT